MWQWKYGLFSALACHDKILVVYRIIQSNHAQKRMLERGISEEDIKYVLSFGEVIEYDKSTGKSLILCWRGERPIHVIVGTNETLKIKRIVTVYEPTDDRWEDNFRRRKQA